MLLFALQLSTVLCSFVLNSTRQMTYLGAGLYASYSHFEAFEGADFRQLAPIRLGDSAFVFGPLLSCHNSTPATIDFCFFKGTLYSFDSKMVGTPIATGLGEMLFINGGNTVINREKGELYLFKQGELQLLQSGIKYLGMNNGVLMTEDSSGQPTVRDFTGGLTAARPLQVPLNVRVSSLEQYFIYSLNQSLVVLDANSKKVNQLWLGAQADSLFYNRNQRTLYAAADRTLVVIEVNEAQLKPPFSTSTPRRFHIKHAERRGGLLLVSEVASVHVFREEVSGAVVISIISLLLLLLLSAVLGYCYLRQRAALKPAPVSCEGMLSERDEQQVQSYRVTLQQNTMPLNRQF